MKKVLKIKNKRAGVAELVDALDSGSSGVSPCGFESRPRHLNFLFLFFVSIFFILFLPSTLKAHNQTIYLEYKISWGPFTFGRAVLRLSPQKLKALARTTGLGNLFYPYKATWTTWLNNESFPLKAEIFSKSRKKTRKKWEIFNSTSKEVIILHFLPTKGKEVFKNLTFPLYEELSAFAKSLTLPYPEISKYKFPVFIKNGTYFIRIKKIKIDVCKNIKELRNIIAKFSEFKKDRCAIVKVFFPPVTSLLKISKTGFTYIDLERQIPLLIIGKIPVIGSLKGCLVDYKLLNSKKKIKPISKNH